MSGFHTPLRADLAAVLALPFLSSVLPLPLAAGFSAVWELADARDDDGNAALLIERNSMGEINSAYPSFLLLWAPL
jgi:hypothetical protein